MAASPPPTPGPRPGRAPHYLDFDAEAAEIKTSTILFCIGFFLGLIACIVLCVAIGVDMSKVTL